MKPQPPPALIGLENWLLRHGYSAGPRTSILRHAVKHRTLMGLPACKIDPRHLYAAQAAFIGSQPTTFRRRSIDGDGSMWCPADDHWSLGPDPTSR